jgi:hypothetical protein
VLLKVKLDSRAKESWFGVRRKTVWSCALKSKPADGGLGRGGGGFQGFQFHKSFAKNFRHRLANLPFRIRIPHRQPALGKRRRRRRHHLEVLFAEFLEIIK